MCMRTRTPIMLPMVTYELYGSDWNRAGQILKSNKKICIVYIGLRCRGGEYAFV